MTRNGRSRRHNTRSTNNGSTILPVPWIGQFSPTAKHAAGDCGPTCIAMVVQYLTNFMPTVDHISTMASLTPGAAWSSFDDLAKAARAFGVSCSVIHNLTFNHVTYQINAGMPVMALVKYDLLNTKTDPNQVEFNGAHFVLLVGHGPRRRAIFHDPARIYGDDFGEYRTTSWRRFYHAMSHTAETPGNNRNNLGMIFNAS